ncbi:Gfo/Idh/MocA family protein [Leptolyngbya sp. AN02str]|uniref:Gfo/Idh/MocA family protein n=1 Tax=Leptolyngbya sp. AN02str TaxID=3423363 RepID=UPI003D31E1B3
MQQIRVGLVGTGYAARLRAETLIAEERSHLVAVVGRDAQRTAEFCQHWDVEVLTDWRSLVQRQDINLVIISTVNRDHGAIAKAALEAGKHVVVEYPLSLDVAEADQLITLAAQQRRLLHVEHIELLSGIHTAIAEALPEIGNPFYVRYSSINPQRPAPTKWTFSLEEFGFPLMGAVSRIHRLTNLFGKVATVSCQARYAVGDRPSPFTACLCTAQLKFVSGLVAEVIYGKGETFWQAERTLSVQGQFGAIAIDGEVGTLILGEASRSIEMGSRRGLFAKDSKLVLDHLTTGSPLYVTPQESLYALKVADAARRSAEQGQTISMISER